MEGVIHYNPQLAHQVDHAEAFRQCGFEAVPTSSGMPADVHVISGPHFALNMWKHHDRVLMIDRAWWGDPDCVSIGWLNPDGTRRFATGDAPRPTPEMSDWKPCLWPTFGELSCLILARYGEDVQQALTDASKRFVSTGIRYHPADAPMPAPAPLDMQVMWYDCVMGAGTAIFEAIRCGIPTICTDPKDECAWVCSDSVDAPLYRGDRSVWLHDMSYKQWSLAEIASGEAWEHLKDVQ